MDDMVAAGGCLTCPGPGSPGPRSRPPGGERGAASVELVVIVPGLVLLIALMTAGWRVWSLRAQVQDAAGAGARAASLARSGAEAQSAAREVVNADLAAVGSLCSAPSVTVDSSGFSTPAGTVASVRVGVSCRVALSDLLVAVPGAIRAEGHSTVRLDTFRERRP